MAPKVDPPSSAVVWMAATAGNRRVASLLALRRGAGALRAPAPGMRKRCCFRFFRRLVIVSQKFLVFNLGVNLRNLPGRKVVTAMIFAKPELELGAGSGI